MNYQDEPEDNTGYKDNMFDRVMAGETLYYTVNHKVIELSLVAVSEKALENGIQGKIDPLVSKLIDRNFDAIDEYEKEESKRAQYDC